MVAPLSVSAGSWLFRAGRFQRAITAITPRKESAFSTNAVATPATAIISPARPGPTARDRLNSIPFNAIAGDRSSFGTSSGKIARHVGASIASPAESPKVSRSSNHGVIVRVIVVAASTMAIPSIHISVRRITLRLCNETFHPKIMEQIEHTYERLCDVG